MDNLLYIHVVASEASKGWSEAISALDAALGLLTTSWHTSSGLPLRGLRDTAEEHRLLDPPRNDRL
ncbi:MAG: hypothetical protein ABIL11_13475 [Chloroflexota bacterium]